MRSSSMLALFLLTPFLLAQVRPRGIYAVVNVASALNTTPPIATLYQSLLANPAVSGLALQVHWDTLNPTATSYDWSTTDAAFAQAAAWNIQNPTQTPKTIQLIVTPGFQSPQWLINQLPLCDGLFQTPVVTPPSTCGAVTFLGFQEAGDGTVFPLPWNPVYKAAWQTFLTALAARYNPNPLFASIAVAGPTAASVEMIVPNDANSNNPQTQFTTPIAPTTMWIQLLAFHYPGQAAYQKSNQAFIDAWDNAIDMYGQVFSGITLVATTGNGLPNFAGATVTIPPAFAAECAVNPNLDCAAETTILSHFVQPTVGGNNAKATQTSGMEASRVGNGSLGVLGVKQVSLSNPEILGGSQFNTRFSTTTLQEGCTATYPPNAADTPVGCTIPSTCATNGCLPVNCIPQACLAPGITASQLTQYKTEANVPSVDLIPPEQAAYNVLSVYFDGTPVASAFNGTPGTAPLNYLQIYSEDIQYSTANGNAPAQVVAGTVTVSITAQALLKLAAAKLFTIGEPAPSISSGAVTIQPGAWVSIYGTNLATTTANWTGNFPTQLAGSSVTIDGKPAYLSYVSPTQINVQAPADSATGTVPVVVTTQFGTATANVTLAQFAPSFFLLDTKHVAGIILHANGSYDILGPTGNSLGYPTVAAKSGDSVALFGTGFGPTSPTVAAGQPYSGAAKTTAPVTLKIGNTTVPTTFAGISSAGLYQLNLTIPSGLASGDLTLQATVGTAQTPLGAVISLQ